MRFLDDDLNVFMVDLPRHVEGSTVPNDDGTYDVYINQVLPEERQRHGLCHEIAHIICGHFDDNKDLPLETKEAQANYFAPVVRWMLEMAS